MSEILVQIVMFQIVQSVLDQIVARFVMLDINLNKLEEEKFAFSTVVAVIVTFQTVLYAVTITPITVESVIMAFSVIIKMAVA